MKLSSGTSWNTDNASQNHTQKMKKQHFCRSCPTVCPETCTKHPRAASWKWCILGTTRSGSELRRWLETDRGPSPRTFTSRIPVSVHKGKTELRDGCYAHLETFLLGMQRYPFYLNISTCWCFYHTQKCIGRQILFSCLIIKTVNYIKNKYL